LRASNECTRRERTQAVGNLPWRGLSGPDCWTAGEELTCALIEATYVNIENVETVGLITVQSSQIPELCTARDLASA
jgi:hypothetical protein